MASQMILDMLPEKATGYMVTPFDRKEHEPQQDKRTLAQQLTHSCPPTVKRSLAIGSPSPMPLIKL